MFSELHCRSAFSFLAGASLPEELVGRAAELGLPALALTDCNGVYGGPRFHAEARRKGVRPIVGAELMLAEGGHLPVLVATRAGYQNLCRLLTRAKLRAPKGKDRVGWDDLEEFSAGVVCLTGGMEGPLAVAPDAAAALDRLVGIFGSDNVYVELNRHYERAQEHWNQHCIELARRRRLPLLASNSVRYALPAGRAVLDVFTCVRHGTRLDLAGRRLERNNERHLKSGAAMTQLFADLPEAIAHTQELAARLTYTLEDLGYEFPEAPVPPGETMRSYLRQRTAQGAANRYGGKPAALRQRAAKQIERELQLIEQLHLEGYFLIVHELVEFCRAHDILAQGRGSAANSAVCYSLGITAVDPVGMELLFERFLSEERGEWPDIDMDLPSGERREAVIQHVYQRYGKHGAAMTANVITYRARSISRELGKVLNFPEALLGRLATLLGGAEYEAAIPMAAEAVRPRPEELIRQAGLDPGHPQVLRFMELSAAMRGLPRHLGQHSGGMVICRGALDRVVPLENASMPGRVVVQWDKDDCAAMGMIKVDLLGLGMMAVLQEAIGIVNGERGGSDARWRSGEEGAGEEGRQGSGEEGNQGRRAGPAAIGGLAAFRGPHPSSPVLDLAQLPPDDPAVFAMLRAADTIGVFQVESRAQMATLPRMRPERFYDLVIEVAIIRPGPIVGQMVHPFFRRRAGKEPVTYAHPTLEPILKRTLGIPLFQEQLLRMAMAVAGFTGGEADELRRALGMKR
ncbi:MAG: DNA polymerase III subunit alpha, partial [Terriglobales bacterium]